jgi:hypothetical protein
MTIIKVTEFLRTPLGRLSNFLLIIAILNLNSCTVYKAAETNADEVRAKEMIMNNLAYYKFFVHDDYNSYALSNPSFNADGSISGDLVLTTYQTPDSTWSKQEKKEYWKNHKYDINIYTSTALSDLRADGGDEVTTAVASGVTISADMISKMTITSIDMEGELAGVALVMLIVVGVLVLLSLLILLIAVAVGDGADSSSDGSGDSGSGSNSDSGSGGSGSGSS